MVNKELGEEDTLMRITRNMEDGGHNVFTSSKYVKIT